MKKFQLSPFGWMVFRLAVCFGFFLTVGWSATAHCCAGGKKPKFSWERAKEKQQSYLAVLHVCRTAEVTTMNCLMKKSGDKDAHNYEFQISVRNITQKARAYNLNLFLPDGASEGGIALSEEKSARLKPGEEKTMLLPIHFKKRPETVALKIENPWSYRSAPVLLLQKCKYFLEKLWHIFLNSSSEVAAPEIVRTTRVYCQAIR